MRLCVWWWVGGFCVWGWVVFLWDGVLGVPLSVGVMGGTLLFRCWWERVLAFDASVEMAVSASVGWVAGRIWNSYLFLKTKYASLFHMYF